MTPATPHPFDTALAPDRALRHGDLLAWRCPGEDGTLEGERLYLTLVRPSDTVRQQVLADYAGHLRSFGLDGDKLAFLRGAWSEDPADFMEESDYALVPPTVLFEIHYHLDDDTLGRCPLRLYAQAVTERHAVLLYHQHSVQLVPIIVGVIGRPEEPRTAALLLRECPMPIFPLDRLWDCESDLPLEELARLSYAGAHVDVPLVLDPSTEGLRLLLKRDWHI